MVPGNESTLSGSSSERLLPNVPIDVINPRISVGEFLQANASPEAAAPEAKVKKKEVIKDRIKDVKDRIFEDKRGSGSDLNSDLERLRELENRLDKLDEDTFPASDAPPSPMIGISWRDFER